MVSLDFPLFHFFRDFEAPEAVRNFRGVINYLFFGPELTLSTQWIMKVNHRDPGSCKL